MSRIVLDAGALIALERDDRLVWGALKIAASRTTDVYVPASALAQVWRGRPTQARLAKALQYCMIASFDEVAREVGELCGRAGTKDICDAHVAIVAVMRGDVLYTSDPTDMRRLIASVGGRKPVIIRC